MPSWTTVYFVIEPTTARARLARFGRLGAVCGFAAIVLTIIGVVVLASAPHGVWLVAGWFAVVAGPPNAWLGFNIARRVRRYLAAIPGSLT